MVTEDMAPRPDTVPRIDLSTVPSEEFSSLKKSLSRISTDQYHHQDVPPPPPKGHRRGRSTESFHIDIPHMPPTAEVALAALQYLPTPLLVLSSLKTIVLANEAMGRLLGIANVEEQDGDNEAATDVLRGQTLSQIGVDMISEGAPVWVSWEKFLDTLVSSLTRDENGETTPGASGLKSGELTPVAAPETLTPSVSRERKRGRSPGGGKTTIHDTVVDVIVTSQNSLLAQRGQSRRSHTPKSPGAQVSCRMIISVWNIENQRFFTMSFTSPAAQHHASNSHVVPRAKSSQSTKSSRSAHSHTPSSSTSSSAVQSPSPSEGNASTPNSFLPSGAPAKCTPPVAFNEFQKITRMKDVMLRATEIPLLAMWRDESVVFPNPAARRLLAVSADATSEESYDFMSRFKPWSADFSRELEDSDNPIISLCRTQKPFTRWQIGLINGKTGIRSNFDVSGHPVFDEKNGEFFAGLISFKDVTEYTERIATQNAENEEQFSLICDMMPQMLWTTNPDGYHTYFSQRWYDYTGLTPQNSLGLGWKLPFHDDDMAETGRKWMHSLATGETYNTEYRCRRYDGEWRWMLGRAMPLRDSKTGEILKWFGTCTDIQDIVDARESGRQMRQQLLDVLHHSQMNMWIVDSEGKLTFFEGSTFEGLTPDQVREKMLGLRFADVLRKSGVDGGFLTEITASSKRILHKESTLELHENENKGRWWRCKLVPLTDSEGEPRGVIGISTEVTNMRRKEQENIQLLANESAAKEASKMKSSFLANMSHEIRTPIHGVLGMAEVLMDTKLDSEQSEFVQNVQRSANSLLTVVNDILDFSKIESGRLDIEEVQFSLGVVLNDVAKMLSYAAQRKNLTFSSDMQLGKTDDLVLLGDPGRLRQILTNLLTNSIKFTSEGHVRMTAKVLSTTSDTTIVEFGVEDTGIGIEEEVKKRLFRPFSQADSSTARRFGGTGLGLTISKNLVDLMKGSISLQSKLGSGTTAAFTIPFKRPEFSAGASPMPLVEISAFPDRIQSELSLSCENSSTAEGKTRISPPIHSPKSVTSMKVNRASLPAPSREDTPQPEIERSQHHILVVEDNAVNQQIAIRFIKSLKFAVSAVWNGREALEYVLKATSDDPVLQKQCPLPSLILMDCQMPILDGYDATHLLRHHVPYSTIEGIKKIPIIAMTASAIQGDRERCERAGMDDYLAKPVQRPVLDKMIMKWIEKSTHWRRASLAPLDVEKPSLVRSGTDHSLHCDEHNAIATEWYTSLTSKTPTMPASDSFPEPAPVMTPSRAPANEGVRRSSLSRALLGSEMPGGQEEGDRAMMRAETEEKARTLRDAKLIHATEDEHGKSPVAIRAREVRGNPFERSLSFDSTGNPMQKSYPTQGASESAGGVMALTKENVDKFNHLDEGAPSSPLRVSPAMIPGPPPDLEITVSSSPRRTIPVPVRANSHEAAVLAGSGLKVKRADLGTLQESDKKTSDRSNGTAKPRRKSSQTTERPTF